MRLLQPFPARSASAPRPLRACVLASAVLSLALVLALAASAGAAVREAGARHSTCPTASKHAKHAKRPSGHCTKRSSRRTGEPVRQPARRDHPVKRTPHPGAPSKARPPALCEDGSTPVKGQEGFTCADGSEPGCEDGSEPLPAGDGEPFCEAPAGEGGSAGEEASAGECFEAGGCEAGEAGCESAPQEGEAGLVCEGSQTAGDSGTSEAERARSPHETSLRRLWAS